MRDFLDFLLEERVKNKNASIKILAIQGSARNKDCCPDHESKSYKLLKNAIKDRKDVIFDVIDLSVKCDGNIVQPCKSCISTAGGIHCHWPCDCYSKGSKIKDFMHEENVYEKLEKCDGFVIFSPINWDAPSSVVKSFFDRLVCCNLTLKVEDAKKVLGEDNLKNSEITRSLAKSGKYNNLLKNHLEGKFAAFFMQGDNGADDYVKIKKPDSYIEYTKDKNSKSDPISSIEPIVKQLVYSGIFVKKGCVDGMISGFGTDYPTNDEKLNQELFKRSRKVVDNLINHISASRGGSL
jgi:multimeric flavodoxin WrbA